jgi:class 3 adenylate cyclase
MERVLVVAVLMLRAGVHTGLVVVVGMVSEQHLATGMLEPS